MNISELISLSERQAHNLGLLLLDAARVGDIELMSNLQGKINVAAETLMKLKTLI